mmetsp:Transcript_36594/g.53588  ORF Transcript_36594/g.53588 Transcript_36594/m.53588 type:complete len:81 (-) Transcript_36594:1063-1305(-)
MSWLASAAHLPKRLCKVDNLTSSSKKQQIKQTSKTSIIVKEWPHKFLETTGIYQAIAHLLRWVILFSILICVCNWKRCPS